MDDKTARKYPDGHSVRYWKRNPDKLALALAEEVRSAASQISNEELEKRPRALEWAILRLSVPLAFVSGGIFLMLANWFLSGVITLYAGLALFAADLAYEQFFGNIPRSLKLLSGVLYIAAIVFCSWKWIFVPAPIQVSASSDVPVYASGSNLDGISWLPRYSELTVGITNPASFDYEGFDALLSTDLVINHLVQTGGLAQCTIQGAHGISESPHWQRTAKGKPVGQLDDPAWEYQAVPIGKDGKRMLPFSAADWSFRIHCDRIPAHSDVGFLAALVSVNPNAYDCNAPCPYPFFDPPRPAKQVTVEASYETSGRKRNQTVVIGEGSL